MINYRQRKMYVPTQKSADPFILILFGQKINFTVGFKATYNHTIRMAYRQNKLCGSL